MTMIRRTHIQNTERAVLYRKGDAVRVLTPGRYWVPAWPLAAHIERFDVHKALWLSAGLLDTLLAADGVLEGHVEVIELGDTERALVWVDGRFERVLGAGRWAYWTGVRQVTVQRVPATLERVTHAQLQTVLEVEQARGSGALEVFEVPPEHRALVYRNGDLMEQLGPGRYAYWAGLGRLSTRVLDLREQVLDVAGQELMTSDKVTLRLNATLTYRVSDAELAVQVAENADQALYREAQLALREVVGARDLETLLSERDAVARELHGLVTERARANGLEVRSLGIRDIVLPGEMKAILNRVVEAQRNAEANLITRREETAAMRSQANTARMLESNPTLMRLRELEVLEKVAEQSNLQIVLGETGLQERLLKLI